MNNQEKTIVGLLFVTLLVWFFYQDGQAKRQRRILETQRRAAAESVAGQEEAGETPVETSGSLPAVSNAAPLSVAPVEPAPEMPAVPVPAEEPDARNPEQTLMLSNDVASVVISSWGGGIRSVCLNEYRETLDRESGPVQFDFSCRPALAYGGLAGFSTNVDFDLVQTSAATATIRRAVAGGLQLVRQVALEDGYRLNITDTFVNDGAASADLPMHRVFMGAMQMGMTNASEHESIYLEVDTMIDQSGQRVQTWGQKFFPKLFGVRSSGFSCARPDVSGLAAAASHTTDDPLAWAAVKNKFFVQILAPEGGSAGCDIQAIRDTSVPALSISCLSADMIFGPRTLAPQQVFQRDMSYYVGPKRLSLLKKLGQHQDMVMFRAWAGFGWYRTLCVWVLWTLNKLYDVIPNYGVAIILVTILVRLLFWPVTHKSTLSMKKMQEIQPLVAELRAKYKDKPQKLQQETMALYKKHKVNPMASCLPMLVQMPVFIALFNVLRDAVELRFAPFLWVSDLSQSEGLFRDVLPIELNILPLLMTATSFLQNKLTPSASDPQQKAMSNIMPFFLLIFFYKMASGLVLYWTVSQVLAIAQLAWQKWQAAHKPTAT